MMLQLSPQIPVYLPEKDVTGYAIALIDYSQDHFLHFVVGLDTTGEIWIVPNNEVRLIKNYSIGRR